MFKHTVKFTDYNGEPKEKDVYFYLSVPEVLKMQHSMPGGYGQYLEKISKEKDPMQIWNAFDEIINAAYGEKSLDGERFIKEDENGVKLVHKFKQTPAYEELMVQLLSDSDLAANMVNGMIPSNDQMKKMQAIATVQKPEE